MGSPFLGNRPSVLHRFPGSLWVRAGAPAAGATSERRGTYFGTYSKRQADALRRAHRTASTTAAPAHASAHASTDRVSTARATTHAPSNALADADADEDDPLMRTCIDDFDDEAAPTTTITGSPVNCHALLDSGRWNAHPFHLTIQRVRWVLP